MFFFVKIVKDGKNRSIIKKASIVSKDSDKCGEADHTHKEKPRKKKKKKKRVEGERSSEVANKKLCEFFELFPYKREKLPVYFTRRPKIG
jgi:hypothetical protein